MCCRAACQAECGGPRTGGIATNFQRLHFLLPAVDFCLAQRGKSPNKGFVSHRFGGFPRYSAKRSNARALAMRMWRFSAEAERCRASCGVARSRGPMLSRQKPPKIQFRAATLEHFGRQATQIHQALRVDEIVRAFWSPGDANTPRSPGRRGRLGVLVARRRNSTKRLSRRDRLGPFRRYPTSRSVGRVRPCHPAA